MLTVLDWVVVCAPIALGVLGVWVSIRPPARKYHWYVASIIGFLAIATAAATLYQIRQTRLTDQSTRHQEDDDKRKLQATINHLQKQVTDLSEKSIPKLQGDVSGLKPVKTPMPDLRVRFVHPQEVAIAIDNSAHAGVADKPKYGVALIDLDNLGADFLRIPTQMGDYIRPGDFWGPNQFMGIDAVKTVVKPGDRVFGSVSVSCPHCVKSRGYWLFIKVGDGGWYAEQEGEPKGIANRSAAETLAANPDAYMERLAPQKTRVPIK
jgi:hypothetical protein